MPDLEVAFGKKFTLLVVILCRFVVACKTRTMYKDFVLMSICCCGCVAAAVVVAVVAVLHRNNHILALSFSRSQVIVTSHETKAIECFFRPLCCCFCC